MVLLADLKVKVIYFIWIAFFFAATWAFDKGITSETERTFFNPPPEHIEHFHFGFRESMADSFWLRWVQDVDHCQTFLAPVKEADERWVDLTDITQNSRNKICDFSWGFKMLDVITKLSPKFEMPYLLGAPALSVLVEDYTGATVIFDRGVKEYPDNWQILYRAAYHYQFDLKDITTAGQLLVRAGENGAPVWVTSLASKLYTKAGQLELGLNTLMAYRKAVEEHPDAVKKVDARIAELRKQLAQ